MIASEQMEMVRVLKTELRPDDGRALKGLVDVQIVDLIIHSWRIIKHGNGRAQVSVPLVSWRDRGGRVRYKDLLTVPAELKQRVEVQVLAAWEREMQHDGKEPCLPILR